MRPLLYTGPVADFNPRTPVGCDVTNCRTSANNGDFNPRTPVGCDRRERTLGGIRGDFNPRTPVGCDMANRTPYKRCLTISIHAPQWGATLPFRAGCTMGLNFNPRTPVGCDRRGVSHTAIRYLYFNPRTPVGCDIRAWLMPRSEPFQSTHPSGVRRQCRYGLAPHSIFQSTHPSGVRHVNNQRADLAQLFQSTHPSGVRLDTNNIVQVIQ